jgi:hypothetical protein
VPKQDLFAFLDALIIKQTSFILKVGGTKPTYSELLSKLHLSKFSNAFHDYDLFLIQVNS